MQIQCRNCGHTEVTNLGLFVKIIGGAAPVGGFWAWTAYLFAGTGFALPIVVAIITGGVGMLVFKDQIVLWLTNKGYQCSQCHASNWQPLVATAIKPPAVSPPAPVQPRSKASSNRGTLHLLIIVGGVIWLAYIFSAASNQAPVALPAPANVTHISEPVGEALPKAENHGPRNPRKAEKRHIPSDLRDCLSLKTNEAIAKCAERPQ